ncbi:MAG: hypothetical protein WD886_04020 [Burkholderiales bacterium]
MNKRILATLVATSFAGLMLSSPSFATDADKKSAESESARNPKMQEQADKNIPRPLGTPIKNQVENTPPPNPGAPLGRSKEGDDERVVSSKQAVAVAKADFKAAVAKCDARPTGQRTTCMQDAKAAQTLAMEKSRDGKPATSGAREKRIPGPQSAK